MLLQSDEAISVIKNTNKSIWRQEKINYNYNMFYINTFTCLKYQFSVKFAVSKIKENKQGLKQHRLHVNMCTVHWTKICSHNVPEHIPFF